LTAGVIDWWQITAESVDISGKFTANFIVASANMGIDVTNGVTDGAP
jgi:hypothetical protein